ncbi:TPA: hypothetical protein ACWOXJ_004882, partial [Salmonella enterica subsp. enterica]
FHPDSKIAYRTVCIRAGVRVCQFHRSGAPGKRQPEVVARIVPRVWCQQEVVSIFTVPVRGNSEPTFKLRASVANADRERKPAAVSQNQRQFVSGQLIREIRISHIKYGHSTGSRI